MSAIRIQLLAGPQAGLQTTLTGPQITFGRVPGNTLTLNIPEAEHLSRQHGELVAQGGGWALVTHSPNGSTVNGKKVKAGKVRVLKPGDVVGVGKVKLFAVHFTPEAAVAAAAEDASGEEAAADGGGLNKRSKLWIAIGGYMMVMMAVIVVFALREPPERTRVVIEELTDRQIAQEVRDLYQRQADPREFQKHRDLAREWAARAGSSPDAHYRALHHYKLALAFSGKSSFPDDQDQLRYTQIETELIDKLQAGYRDAIALKAHRKWRPAEDALRMLDEMYPDADSRFNRNIQLLLNDVRSNRPRRKGGFR